ncbi:uncharacterized protein TRIVIDRAFT_35094 [Trichoderma virens Gv29-8]|uniref:Uncharacterized protein n=1 Tax=Hypocrea virens (strain Gv29-8 / FGSC 10586) TaxID=413071 RepID=G9MEY0_HYPVG|nr:uncharacterized protein TRIVIDRAFT_35094 [Trichoderma virens Gv29-8]EHK26948.1 hypothetical protein TRIVIDRAFT_35094 [Trichoderma virens Gv29-8]UKZ57400.1 hypothetical protein TrVGV298_011255 [Trichoderma virens]
MSTPPSSDRISSSPPSPVALTLRRRERDERRRQEEQYSHGRPRPSRKLCGNEQCLLRCCNVFKTTRYYLPDYLLGDKDRSVDDIPVKDIQTHFAYLAATRIWPSIEKQSDVILKAQSIEAFAASPPVRAAYLDFRSLCQKNGLNFTIESRLRESLSVAMPQFRSLIETLNPGKLDGDYTEMVVHRTLQPPQQSDQTQTDKPLPWTQEGCTMRFLLTIELWRRHDETHTRRRGWAWEPWIVAELLSAVLLHYWLLDREKCFERVSCRGSEQCDEVWQEWLDKYPLLGDSSHEDDDETDEEEKNRKAEVETPDLVPKPIGLIKGLDLDKDVGYVGGVGTAARGPLWRDMKQQKHGDDGLPQH